MAGDGFVRMPGEPERWVRLIEGGYHIATPYADDDRQDLIVCLDAGHRFNSTAVFGNAIEDLFSILNRSGVADIVRAECFSQCGSDIIRAAKAGVPSISSSVASIVDARIDREFKRECARNGSRRVTEGSNSSSTADQVAHWKQLMLSRNERGCLDFVPDEDYEPDPSDWELEPFPRPDGIEYLLESFWRELGDAVGAYWDNERGGFYDYLRPLGIDDSKLKVGLLCELIAGRLTDNALPEYGVYDFDTFREVRRLYAYDLGDPILDEHVSHFRLHNAFDRKGFRSHLLNRLSKGPRCNDGPRAFETKIVYTVKGALPREVAECVNALASLPSADVPRDSVRSTDANRQATVAAPTECHELPTPPAKPYMTEANGFILHLLSVPVDTPTHGTSRDVVLAKLLAAVLMKLGPKYQVRKPEVHKWMEIDRKNMDGHENESVGAKPGKLDIVGTNEFGGPDTSLYSGVSVLQWLHKIHGIPSERELKSCNAWDARLNDVKKKKPKQR